LLNHPLIANVRSIPSSKSFDHWIVAIADAGDILVYDGVAPAVRLRTAEFLGLWNGVGILVSPLNSSPLLLLWAGRVAIFQIGFIAVAALCWFGLPRHIQFRESLMRQAVAFVIVTTVLAFVGQWIFGDWRNYGEGVAVAAAPFRSATFTHGTLADARRASQSADELLIDARNERDFNSGTIPNAVNIPVYASVWNMREYLQGVDKHISVVVFCQSNACDYDEVIARNLSLIGFTKVVVCNEGWREYSLQSNR
jgi:rhodanese-related sulfurtransferase